MFVRFQDSSPISDSPPESTAEKASEEFVKVVPKSSPPVKQEDTKPVEEPVEKAPEKVEEPSEEFKSTPDKVESVQKKPEKESEKAEPAADKADEDASSDDDGVDLDRYLTEAKTSMKKAKSHKASSELPVFEKSPKPQISLEVVTDDDTPPAAAAAASNSSPAPSPSLGLKRAVSSFVTLSCAVILIPSFFSSWFEKEAVACVPS